ncbi:MAG: response regulator, partial [Acidobacteria bacterium]|nr:response regulator [Acidobacteriota bacterium]
VKFTEKGEIELRVQPRRAVERGEIELVFSVRDTGNGIAPELQHAIFEPFRQLDGSFTREQGGTGLGLALSRQIVAAMGGSIEVESVPGRGSTFTFQLPLHVAEDAALPAPEPDFVGKRALVVHPSGAAQSSLAETLLVLGLRARGVSSLGGAIDATRRAVAEHQPFHVILADPALALGPGFTALRESLGSTVLIAASRTPADPHPAPFRGAVVFPVSLAALREELLKSARNAGSEVPHAGRILVVEDNPVNRKLVVTLLRREGHEVAEAEHGRQALAALAEHEFDLVLMDVQMPVMDGLEAARRMRSDPRWHDLPVIALTAHALSGDRDLCLAAGMNDYLTKPVQRVELLSLVSRWLERPAEVPAR